MKRKCKYTDECNKPACKHYGVHDYIGDGTVSSGCNDYNPDNYQGIAVAVNTCYTGKLLCPCLEA